MDHLTHSIDVNEKPFIFYLNRMHTVKGLAVHISVHDSNHTLHYFLIRKINDDWFFEETDNLPEWIIVLENKLNDTIKNKLSI